MHIWRDDLYLRDHDCPGVWVRLRGMVSEYLVLSQGRHW